MKILFTSIIFCFLISSACLSKSSISGNVIDSVSGEYMISTTVAIYSESGAKTPLRGTYTNKYGYYSITKLEQGKYFIKVSNIGYKTFSKSIELSAYENLRLNIKLAPQDIESGTILVEDNKFDASSPEISTVDISPDFIDKMPSIGGEVDIFRTLQLLPGISSSNELSSGLYVRGGSPDQNLYLLDDVIVYNPSHLGGFISSFNNDAIRDIKMIKGAMPAEYGGRLSSVLDLKMKEGTKEDFSGKGGISMISSKLLFEGPIGENSSYMISGRRFYLDLLVGLVTNEAPKYYFYDVNAKVNHKIDENNHLFLSGYFGNDVLEDPEDTNNDFQIDWGNSTGNLRWMHIISPTLFTNFSFIYTNYSFSTSLFESNESFTSSSKIEDFTLKGEVQYYPAENHNIKTGVELTNHLFVPEARFSRREFEDNTRLGKRNISTLDLAFFIQDEWEITDRWNSNIGFRTYYFQEGNYFDIEPRFSTNYKIAGNIKLKGAFAIANQYLHLITRNEIALPTDLWFPSTESIEPSRSIQGVLGAETTFLNKMFLFSVEGYYKTMENLYAYRDDAEFTLGLPLEEQFTSGKGKAYGVELFLNKRLGDFTGWIGYTMAWTTRQFDELNNGKEFFPRYDRRHDVSITFTYELSESWELGVAWVFATGKAYTMPAGVYKLEEVGEREDFQGGNGNEKYLYTGANEARMPSYHRLDLNFMHNFEWFGIPWQASFNIYNAYDRRNAFAWYLTRDYSSFSSNPPKKVEQISLFPILPTIGLSFEF